MTATNKSTPAKVARPVLTDMDRLFQLASGTVHPDVFSRMYSIVTERDHAKKEQAWHDAMRACQSDMGPISKDAANAQTRSKYATLGALDEVLRPIYVEHGFDVTFGTEPARDGNEAVQVTLTITHEGGWQRTTEIEMPCDGKGSAGKQVMTRTHAMGSATTYGRRYLLTMAFNISVVDDDGNAATEKAQEAATPPGYTKVTTDQADKLVAIADEAKADKRLLCVYLSNKWKVDVKSIADIPSVKYGEVIEQLALKKQATEDAAKQQSQ